MKLWIFLPFDLAELKTNLKRYNFSFSILLHSLLIFGIKKFPFLTPLSLKENFPKYFYRLLLVFTIGKCFYYNRIHVIISENENYEILKFDFLSLSIRREGGILGIWLVSAAFIGCEDCWHVCDDGCPSPYLRNIHFYERVFSEYVYSKCLEYILSSNHL